MTTTYSWRSAAVVGSLLALGLVGGPILPDYYVPEVRAYLPSLVLIPASIAFSFACFRSPVRDDRLFGVLGCVIGGGLFVAFVLRALYYLGVVPAWV